MRARSPVDSLGSVRILFANGDSGAQMIRRQVRVTERHLHFTTASQCSCRVLVGERSPYWLFDELIHSPYGTL
jgi:hypothetical protein